MKLPDIHPVVIAVLIVFVSGCAKPPVLSDVGYIRAERQHLYGLGNWEFQGRFAVRDARDSWSANINWRHQKNADRLKLSGPLGQGAVEIVLTDGHIVIDRGEGDLESSDDPDVLIRQHLGVFVPVESLQYWVLGLPHPDNHFMEIKEGFIQSGWSVSIPMLMQADDQLMPHKLVVANNETKLKLIIDQWVLNDRSSD